MKRILNWSGGKDSTAMLLICFEKNIKIDEVAFYNTGVEFEAIYRNREKIKSLLYNKGIKFTELTPKEPFLYSMLIRPVKYRDPFKEQAYHYGYEWCGGKCRWATRHKLDAIKNHYKNNYQNEEIIEYIGIAADELHREKTDKHKRYPLIEYGMTEADCLKYCYDNGFDWKEGNIELYDILDRVSCWLCRNKNLKELKNIYLYLPEYWQKLKGLQTRIDEPFKGPGKSIFDLEERFKNELNQHIRA